MEEILLGPDPRLKDLTQTKENSFIIALKKENKYLKKLNAGLTDENNNLQEQIKEMAEKVSKLNSKIELLEFDRKDLKIKITQFNSRAGDGLKIDLESGQLSSFRGHLSSRSRGSYRLESEI